MELMAGTRDPTLRERRMEHVEDDLAQQRDVMGVRHPTSFVE